MTNIVAFTADHVCRLTGLSSRQLRYWDATDFFSPTLLDDFPRRAFGRIYSFRDVVGLRTIAVLRNVHKVPLQELRRVGSWLLQHHEFPWSDLRFALVGRKVVFRDPQSREFFEPEGGGQQVIPIDLEVIATDVRNEAERLRERRADQIGQVNRNRYIVHNAWVVSGTRVTTQAVWNFHAAGFDDEAIIQEYPQLTAKDVRAAIEFEAKRRAA